jgi:tryptophan-specific transport protein
MSTVVFVLVFAFFVWHSTSAVDRIAIVLIAFMILSFTFGIFGLAAHIDMSVLFNSMTTHASYARYLPAMLPVALTSFGYHHSVSTMRAYYGNETRAKYAILGGTAIALTLYYLWIVSIYGNLPMRC